MDSKFGRLNEDCLLNIFSFLSLEVVISFAILNSAFQDLIKNSPSLYSHVQLIGNEKEMLSMIKFLIPKAKHIHEIELNLSRLEKSYHEIAKDKKLKTEFDYTAIKSGLSKLYKKCIHMNSLRFIEVGNPFGVSSIIIIVLF